MKKFLTVLLILVMVFTFAACGNGGDQGDGGNAEVSFDDISETTNPKMVLIRSPW